MSCECLDELCLTLGKGVLISCIAYSIYQLSCHIMEKRTIPKVMIRDKYVLITGCDFGFGESLARLLDSEGVHVFAACLTQKGADSLKKSCSSRLHTLCVDVTNSEQIQQALQDVNKSLPPGQGLWGIVSNAGILGNMGPAEWHNRDDYRKVLEVNTLGMIEVCSAFSRLVAMEQGRIVITASIISRCAVPCMAPYVTSKFAIAGFTEGFRREMNGWGVQVISIQPGAHKTNLIDKDIMRAGCRKVWDRQSQQTKDEYGENYYEKMLQSGIEVAYWTGCSSKQPVVNAYYRGLFSKHPKTVYTVGWDTWYVYLIPTFVLPSVVVDFMCVYILGLKPKGLKQDK